MKKIAPFLFLFLACVPAIAQELAFRNSYVFNRQLLNPALSGWKDHWHILLTDYRQWLGFEQAPRTQSLHTGAKYKQHGIALTLFNDRNGVSTHRALRLAYSHQISPGTEKNSRPAILFGAGFLYRSFRFDPAGLHTQNPNDPALNTGVQQAFSPDLEAGVHFAAQKWQAGLSAVQLLNHTPPFGESQNSPFARQVLVYTSYKIEPAKLVALEPMLVFKFNQNAEKQADANLRFVFLSRFWLNVSYRYNLDSFPGKAQRLQTAAGAEILPNLHCAYCYELWLGGIGSFSGATHQLMLAYSIPFSPKTSPCPAYWR